MKKILNNIVVAISMVFVSSYAIASFQEDVNNIKSEIPRDRVCQHCSIIKSVKILSYDESSNEITFSMSIISNKNNFMDLLLPLNSLEIIDAQIGEDKKSLLMRRDNNKASSLYGVVPLGESTLNFKAKILENKIPFNFPDANVESIVDEKKLSLSYVGNLLYLVKSGIELTANSSKKDTRVKNFTLSSEPLFQVSRNLNLGNTWNLQTKVSSLFLGTQDYIKVDNTIKIPLLTGEKVISEEIKVEDGFVIVNLENRDSLAWNSVIESISQINIKPISPNVLQNISINNEQTDWLFNISINDKAVKENNVQMWPTDNLLVSFSLPKSKSGNFNVVKSVVLEKILNKEKVNSKWSIEIESSLGGSFTIKRNDDKSQILEMSNQGSPISFREDNGNVTFFINSGKNILNIETSDNRKPSFVENNQKWDFGVPTYNYKFDIQNQSDRWVIWAGGDMVRPSVLLLGYVLLVLIFSFALSKIHSIFNGLTWVLILFGLSNMPLLFICLMILAMVLVGNRSRALNNNLLDLSNKENIARLSKVMAVCAVYAVSVLVFSAGLGLLGSSNSFIVSPLGGNSLTWMTDIYNQTNAYMFSLPKLYYKTFMFLWSIWLAFIIVKLIIIIIGFIKKLNEQ